MLCFVIIFIMFGLILKKCLDIIESKRLNIPIVIIKMTRLKNENKVDTGFDNERDKYIDDSYSEKTGKKLR